VKGTIISLSGSEELESGVVLSGHQIFILLAHNSIRLDRSIIANIEIVPIFIVLSDWCQSLSLQSDKGKVYCWLSCICTC
jgi:hypothetical protein